MFKPGQMREQFASENFNFQDFLAKNSEVSTEKLILNLESISKTVQNELYRLINGDLVHFKSVLNEVCEIDIEAIKEFRTKFEANKVIQDVTS